MRPTVTTKETDFAARELLDNLQPLGYNVYILKEGEHADRRHIAVYIHNDNYGKLNWPGYHIRLGFKVIETCPDWAKTSLLPIAIHPKAKKPTGALTNALRTIEYWLCCNQEGVPWCGKIDGAWAEAVETWRVKAFEVISDIEWEPTQGLYSTRLLKRWYPRLETPRSLVTSSV